ncbi:MAG: DnaT-like ssDNA-binding protein [Pseudomonadota bacterium]
MAYGTDAAFTAYATARGVTLPDHQSSRDQLRAKATTFVDGLGWKVVAGVPVNRFPGKPTSATQLDAWPRTGATDTYGNEIASGSVPTAIENAAYEAAIFENASAGALNQSVRDDQRVVREKFDVIEFQYADSGAVGSSGQIASSVPVIPSVMTLLAPYLSGGSNGLGITAVVA